MSINKVQLKDGTVLLGVEDVETTSANVLQGVKFIDNAGNKGIGELVPQGGGSGEETYTIVLDCEFEPDMNFFPVKPTSDTGDNPDYFAFAKKCGSASEFEVPTGYMLTELTFSQLDERGIDYNVYLNNELITLDGFFLRGQANETYTFRLEVLWDAYEEPIQISAADCKFDGNRLVSYMFNDAQSAPTNIILPSSYNRTSQAANIDCRLNNISNTGNLENYLRTGNIYGWGNNPPPVTYPCTLYSTAMDTEINNNFGDIVFDYDRVDALFEISKVTFTLNSVIRTGSFTTQDMVNFTVSWTDNGEQSDFQFNGNISAPRDSTLIDVNNGLTYYLDDRLGYFICPKMSLNEGYYVDTNNSTINKISLITSSDPSWTVEIRYNEYIFSDGNDYTVTTIGSGNYSIFEEAEPWQAIYSNRVRRVVIPNSVTDIAPNAFNNCNFIREYVLPNGIVRIGSLVGCYTTLTIPNSVVELDHIIGNFASLTIPSGVQYGYDYNIPFISSYPLKTLNIQTTSNDFRPTVWSPNLEIINGIKFSEYPELWELVSLKRVNGSTDGEFNFGDLTQLPEGISSFAENVESVSFSSLIDMPGEGFSQCYKLTEMTLPDTIESINNIELCCGPNIQTLTIQADNPPQLGFALPLVDGKLQANPNLSVIYVPQLSVEAYKEDTNWSVYADLIEGDPNNEGHGPTPEPQEEGIFFYDITTGATVQMNQDMSNSFSYDNFYFEQGHEYRFNINLNGNSEQGWPNGGTNYSNSFPDGNGETYLSYTGNSVQVLQGFIGRARLKTNYGNWTLASCYSTIKYNSDPE